MPDTVGKTDKKSAFDFGPVRTCQGQVPPVVIGRTDSRAQAIPGTTNIQGGLVAEAFAGVGTTKPVNQTRSPIRKRKFHQWHPKLDCKQSRIVQMAGLHVSLNHRK